jgi:hypothetical protein
MGEVGDNNKRSSHTLKAENFLTSLTSNHYVRENLYRRIVWSGRGGWHSCYMKTGNVTNIMQCDAVC